MIPDRLLDLLPTNAAPQGAAFLYGGSVSLHSARSGAGAETQKVPGAASASFQDSLSHCIGMDDRWSVCR